MRLTPEAEAVRVPLVAACDSACAVVVEGCAAADVAGGGDGEGVGVAACDVVAPAECDAASVWADDECPAVAEWTAEVGGAADADNDVAFSGSAGHPTPGTAMSNA